MTTSEGWFVRPTLITADNPKTTSSCTEYFGPILAHPRLRRRRLRVGPGRRRHRVPVRPDRVDPRHATVRRWNWRSSRLRFTAGNFYINDKPTGAVVGQQPFGGARASGTNDKAGSMWNLMRWVSPRSIKETLVAPTETGYPHMR